MVFQIIHPVEPAHRVKEYYSLIHTAIGGCIDDNQLWLVKKEGWIATVAYDGYFYEDEDEARFIQTLLNFGYEEFIAASWSKACFYPSIYIIPSSIDGIEEFRLNSYSWYVFFAGRPDWFILLANTLDFIIVAGQPEFVRQVLGCEPKEAYIDIQEMSESKNLNSVVRKYYSHLIKQIQTIYPQVGPGTVINLGLLDWEE